MRLIIVSGLSGSGKSVALNVLEDLGYYCIDNIPVGVLRSVVEQIISMRDPAYDLTAVGVDARNRAADIDAVPPLVEQLRRDRVPCEVVFLHTEDEVLLKRFRETRRRHPLLRSGATLHDAIARERELLAPIVNIADLTVDTTRMSVYDLRDTIRTRVADRDRDQISILVESFGFKHGLPSDADFVFDVRCLPNPYWEPRLRPLNGRDRPVAEFLEGHPQTEELLTDIISFLHRWLPRFEETNRNYLTVAVGCTGGQHRSVYVAERIADALAERYGPVLTRHNELPDGR